MPTLTAFEIFSFSLMFRVWLCWPRCGFVVSCVCAVWSLWSLWDLWVEVFHQIWKYFGHYLFKYFFCPILSFFPIQMSTCFILSYMSLKLCSLFSFCFNLDNVHGSVFKFSVSFVHNVQSTKKGWFLPGIQLIKAPCSICSLGKYNFYFIHFPSYCY